MKNLKPRINWSWLIALPALLLGNTLATGCATQLSASEKMMWSTYAIATENGVGTCMVVNRRDPAAPGGIVPVVITSAHLLARAPRGPYFLALRFPQEGDNPAVALLEMRLPPSEQLAYVRHPRYDVAAFAIRVPPEIFDQVNLASFVDENAISRTTHPRVGQDIGLVGFPKVFPGTQGAFPILRAGRVASYSLAHPGHREQFLVHTNVYSGDSGGAVFHMRGRTPRVIGLITDRVGKEEGSVPLAVAVDNSVIRETLDLLTAEETAALASGATGNRLAPGGSSVRLVGPRGAFRKILGQGTGRSTGTNR